MTRVLGYSKYISFGIQIFNLETFEGILIVK